MRAEIRLAGDTFEMEDQGNWTDASFKTYSTPLRLPIPVEVQPGATVAQSVQLHLHGDRSPPPVRNDSSAVTLSVGATPVAALPRLGLGTASHGQTLTPQEVTRLRALRLSHLRVDVSLADAAGIAALERAASEAQALDVPLEVALTLSANAADKLAHLAEQLRRLAPPVCTWLVFHEEEPVTSPRWIQLARPPP